MFKVEESKGKKIQEPRKYKTRFLAELEKLKKNPLYPRALEEVIELEKTKNLFVSVEVYLSVQYPTVFGEKIAVVGGNSEMGDWDPSRACEMIWSEGNIWKCSLVCQGIIKEIQYKYVCIRGTLVKWEGGDNRVIDIKTAEKQGKKLVVIREDIWKR